MTLGMSPLHESIRSQAPIPGPSNSQSLVGSHARSQADQFPSMDYSAIERLNRQRDQRSTHDTRPELARHSTFDGTVYSNSDVDDRYGTLQSSRGEPTSKQDTRYQLRNPNGPSPRPQERNSYGPVHPPLSDRYERHGESPRAIPILHSRLSQGSIPSRHSEANLYRSVYPRIADNRTGFPQSPDRGKVSLNEATRFVDVPVPQPPPHNNNEHSEETRRVSAQVPTPKERNSRHRYGGQAQVTLIQPLVS